MAFAEVWTVRYFAGAPSHGWLMEVPDLDVGKEWAMLVKTNHGVALFSSHADKIRSTVPVRAWPPRGRPDHVVGVLVVLCRPHLSCFLPGGGDIVTQQSVC